MSTRAWLVAATMLSAAPAWAAIDPPAASTNDKRIRTLAYSATNPVTLPVSPGASVRIQLGPDEEVQQVIVSDQNGLGADPEDAPNAMVTNASMNAAAGGVSVAGKWPPSCDVNLCRTVVGNFVYLRPLRPLDPQPLFIQTKRCAAETGKCEMVPYTFELLTRPADVKAAADNVAWAVTFTYPDRAKAAAAAEWQKRRAAQLAVWREQQANRPAPTPTIAAATNVRYGYRGSASIMPDQAWDDGRTTFLRYNGNRRLPDVGRSLPDGKESIPAYAAETDATGTTLRIARTEKKWWVRDGDEAGCVFNIGPDPDGATAPTVALPAPAPFRPRLIRRAAK